MLNALLRIDRRIDPRGCRSCSGRGILLAPSFVVQEGLAAGRLALVLQEWRERSLPLHALWPHRTSVPAKLRAFIDFLAGWFGQ